MRQILIPVVSAAFVSACAFHALMEFGVIASGATVAAICVGVFVFIVLACEMALSQEEKR